MPSLALTSNNRIRTRNSRNDVLDDPLGQAPRHPLNPVLFSTIGRLLIKPLDMIGVIVVQLLIYVSG